MTLNLDEVNTELETRNATGIIRWALEHFGSKMVMSSSFGADSPVLLHLATQIAPGIQVIVMDNDLHDETRQFIQELTAEMFLNTTIHKPPMSSEEMETLHTKLSAKGLEGEEEYQRITKVEPLRKFLRERGVQAVLAGVKAYQTPHRAKMSLVEVDPDGIYHVHPILRWTKDEITAYLERHRLPRNPLYAQGFESIGDRRSTVAGKGREGRRLGQKSECVVNVHKHK